MCHYSGDTDSDEESDDYYGMDVDRNEDEVVGD